MPIHTMLNQVKPWTFWDYALLIAGAILVLIVVYACLRGRELNKNESSGIRKEISSLPLRETEKVYFLGRLDARPKGGLFGGHEDVGIEEARNILEEARTAATGQK